MRKSTHTISILGLGYVGLCTAAAFSARGFKTIGIDVDSKRIEQIRNGTAPFHEPQLDKMLKTALRTKRLEATTDFAEVARADATFITVGTPSRSDGSIDLTYVADAARELGSSLRNKDNYHLVIVKSTVIPGTTTSTVKPVLESTSRKSIGPGLGLCANPEFLKEGSAIHDTFHPDKIVIGVSDKRSAARLRQLYRRFYKGKLPPMVVTTPETAEMIKYASNSFLATRISYINTMANICQNIPSADIATVAEAIGLDPRIGPLFLKAGPGYGGSCFHKDLQALIQFSRQHGYNPTLIEATEKTNQEQPSRVIELARKLLGSLEDRRVAVLGLSFKKDTDDAREAASLKVIDLLQKNRAQVVAYDPMAIPNAKRILADSIEFAPDAKSALKGADCCILMTEWKEFGKLKEEDYLSHMRTPNLVDARRICPPENYQRLNFQAVGLGPPTTRNADPGPVHLE